MKNTYEELSDFVAEEGCKNSNIRFLLDYMSKYPDIYNEVANDLYIQFGIRQAEITLLCSYCVAKKLKTLEGDQNGSDIFLQKRKN